MWVGHEPAEPTEVERGAGEEDEPADVGEPAQLDLRNQAKGFIRLPTHRRVSRVRCRDSASERSMLRRAFKGYGGKQNPLGRVDEKVAEIVPDTQPHSSEGTPSLVEREFVRHL